MHDHILILGKDGMVGRALVARLGSKALAAGRAEVDLAKSDFISNLEKWLAGRPISAVINAAAYTKVDLAEGEGKDEAMRVNGAAVGELAAWCKQKKLRLVHYSTDYVFDGSGSVPWREEDKPNPINAYGLSKLAGEQALKQAGGDSLLIRTSWVYDAQGKNFLVTMLRLFGEKEQLNIVDDQIGAPTYAPQLAAATLAALQKPLPAGTYHLCNAGQTSWHGFAKHIFALASHRDLGIKCQQINPIPTSAYPSPARRPLNSRLDCSKAQKLGIALPPWEEGLSECMQEKYGSSGRAALGT